MAIVEKDLIVACLNDKEILKENVNQNPSYFEKDAYRFIFMAMVDHFNKYGETIPKGYLLQHLRDARNFVKYREGVPKRFKFSPDRKKEFALVFKKIFAIDNVRKYAPEVFKQFARKKLLLESIETVVQRIENDEVDEAFKVLETIRYGDNLLDKGYRIFDWSEGWKDRQEERRLRKEHPERYKILPTPWASINRALGSDTNLGGVQQGEMASFSGTTGKGKSIALAWSAINGVLEDKTGIYYSIENSVWQTLQRMDSSFLNLEYNKIKGHNLNTKQIDKAEEAFYRFKKMLNSKLYVVDSDPRGTTILTLEKAIREVEAKGKQVDFIAVDYADLLNPINKYRDYRLAQREVYWSLKILALTHQIPCITATQAPKEYAEKKGRAEAVSESYDKARLLDILITMYQTADMRIKNEIIMVLAKNRDGVAGIEIPMVTEFERMKIREMNTFI